MKRPWNPNKNDKRILSLLYENREGLRVQSIIKWTGIKQSTVYKRLDILKDKGLIENEFPLWKIIHGQIEFCRNLLQSKDIFELHNLAYIVKLINVPTWWNPMGSQMKNRLMRVRGYQFQRVSWGKNNSNPFNQISNDKYVIQMYPESVIVIHRKRYYGNNPYDTVIEFLQDFYDLWEWFENKMKFKFFLDGVPQMTLRGNDYNRINDALANYVKRTGNRFLVEIGDGRKIWVDLSEPFGKEANTPEVQEILEKFNKDIVLNKPMLNSELQARVSDLLLLSERIIQTENMNSKNIKKHQKVLDGILEEQKADRKIRDETLITLKKIQEGLDKKSKKKK